MKIIDNEIKNFLQQKINNNNQTETESYVNFFYRSQMSPQYKQEERNLKKILNETLTTNDNSKIKLSVYYKNKKLKHLLIKNNIHSDNIDHHVVYQYTCPARECQPSESYIGFTTTSTKQRMSMHAQQGSIKQHHLEKHNERINTAKILENINILYRSIEKTDLLISEALLIKSLKPSINSQFSGENRILNIF